MRASSLILGGVMLAALVVVVGTALEDPDATPVDGVTPGGQGHESETRPGSIVATDASGPNVVVRASRTQSSESAGIDADEAGSAVVGRVEDSHGAPVDGAAVWLWNHPRRAVWHRRGSPQRFGPTSAAGEFRVEPRGDEFLVEAADDAHSCVLAWQGVVSHETAPVVVVAPATVWRGRITREDGTSVRGAQLTITPDWNAADVARQSTPLDAHHRVPMPRRIWPDRDGGFEARLVTGSRYRVSVTAPDCRKLEKSVCFADSHESMVLVIGPGAKIRGQILREGLAALPGARIELIGNDACTARSDASGRFSLSGADPRADSWIGVTAEGHPPRVIRVRIGERVSIVMQRGVTLTGKVVDGLGRPIAGAPILLLRPDDGIHAMARRWLHERLANALATDESGAFKIPNLLAVVHVLMVSDPANPARGHKQRVYVGSGSAAYLILDRRQADAVVLRGVVRDAQTNRPILAFSILPKLFVGGLFSWTRRPFDSDDGTFEIIGLQPGARTIEVIAPGYRTKSLPAREYALGTHVVDVFLQPDGM